MTTDTVAESAILTSNEAAARLNVSTSQVYALVKQGVLKRAGRRHITRLSVESRKDALAYKRMYQGKDGDQPLTKGDKRDIVQILLFVGIITKDDFMAIQTDKLRAVLT